MVIDVISCVAVDEIGVDIRVIGDSRSNGSRDIRGSHFVSNERTNMTHITSLSPKNVLNNVLKIYCSDVGRYTIYTYGKTLKIDYTRILNVIKIK